MTSGSTKHQDVGYFGSGRRRLIPAGPVVSSWGAISHDGGRTTGQTGVGSCDAHYAILREGEVGAGHESCSCVPAGNGPEL